jgi:lipopolysaccharide export system ATP-binding protein
VGLLGPNGAGKTTCFYMLVGLVRPDAGSIRLDERDLTREPMHVRAALGVGYLPQEASVFRRMTVRENLLAVLETRPGSTRSARRARADALLDEFRIAHLAENRGASLSGGERRRLEVARALATDPAFILLDEPFAGVDPISVADLKEVIRGLNARRIGVLITDHDVRSTLSICHRAYIVAAGQVIAAGTPESILADPNVRRVYLGDGFRM